MSEWSKLVKEFDDYFVNQRRAIPKAYACGTEIRDLSREEGLPAVVKQDQARIKEVKDEMIRLWDELRHLPLPTTFGAYQDFDAGQEMIEFFATDAFFSAILKEETFGSVDFSSFSTDALEMNPQTWISGLLEAGSELSRVISEYIILCQNLSREDRKNLRLRFIDFAQELNEFLRHFAKMTPAVVDAYNKYGFRQSLKSKMSRLRGAVEFQKRFVLEAIEHE